MTSDEAFEANVRRALRQAPSQCPDLGQLAAGGVGPEQALVAAHVADCPRCRAVVACSASPTTPGAVTASPQRWGRLQRRAQALAEGPAESIIRVVVRTVRGTLQLIDVVGDLVEPAPVRSDDSDGVMVRRSFGNHSLSAHVDHDRRGRFNLTVDLWSGGSPSDELRITLLQQRRELNSALPRKGRVCFSGLPAGTYRVAVAGRREQVGAIDIALEADTP